MLSFQVVWVYPFLQGWEGGLGSPAFALLLLRLAVLVVIIATAQTCRKYVSLLQVFFLGGLMGLRLGWVRVLS